MPGREGLRENLAKGLSLDDAIDIAGVKWNFTWCDEFGEDLTAKSAGRPWWSGVGDDENFSDFDFAKFTHSFLNRDTLCADSRTVRRVFDVTSRKDLSILEANRSTDLMSTVRTIRMASCGLRCFEKGLKLRRDLGLAHVFLLTDL
jgi:hypothetical protein